MNDRWRIVAVAAVLLSLIGGARAQTVACAGPTGGNCVPVVQMALVGAVGFPFGATALGGSGNIAIVPKLGGAHAFCGLMI
jgi:hypothetical protein